MKKTIFLALGLMALLASPGCKEEDPNLGTAPTAADAVFTYEPSVDNPNTINFERTMKIRIITMGCQKQPTTSNIKFAPAYKNRCLIFLLNMALITPTKRRR